MIEYEMQSCRSCRFKIGDDCHRYPPTLVYVGSDEHERIYKTRFPEAEVWCGEWQEQPPSDEK